MSIYVIYGIRNLITNRWYIGQSGDYERRKAQHLSQLRAKTHINPKLQSAFDKYGESGFEFTVLLSGLTSDEAMRLEVYYINHFDSYRTGYNQTTGGENREDNYKPCEWNGMQYESIDHAAQSLGITYSAMQYRVAKGYKSDEDLRLPKPVTWNGINYPSKTEAAEATGYSQFQMSKYTRRGYSSDEDVNAPRPKKKPRYVRPEFMPQAVKVTWNDTEYPSIADAARANNIPFTSMRRYVDKGYEYDTDVPPATRAVIWNDIEYPELNQAAKAIGVTRKTMRTYLSKGYVRDSDIPKRSK